MKKRTMRRIYVAWLYQKAASMFAIKTYALIGALAYMAHLVSFGNVFANAPHITNIGHTYRFFAAALQNTELAVHISLIAIIALLLFVVRDIHRSAETRTNLVRFQ